MKLDNKRLALLLILLLVAGGGIAVLRSLQKAPPASLPCPEGSSRCEVVQKADARG